MDERGYSTGWSQIQTLGAPAAGGTTYGVKKDGTQVILIASGASPPTLSWDRFDGAGATATAHGPFKKAQFGAETHGGTSDCIPGSSIQPCDFSSAKLREVGGSEGWAWRRAAMLLGSG